VTSTADPAVPRHPAVPDGALVERLRRAGCVFAEDEARLIEAHPATAAQREELVAARVAGTPLEYLLGWAEFGGLRVAITPGVFVPRRRTELMVREAAARLHPGDVLVDLCCGSGAIAAAIAQQVPGLRIVAVDIDPVAVRCAEANLAGLAARVRCGDLDVPLAAELAGHVAVITANTPYVPSAAVATMPPEARDYEKRQALDGGTDGLDVQRRVAAVAARWLAPGGHVMVESSDAQADAAAALFAARGLTTTVVRDHALDAVVVVAQAP
jgi:release factor glutamine methyltransferase